MYEQQWFSSSYSEARQRFIELVAREEGIHTQLPIAARGPDGDSLSIDIGWFGSIQPTRAILHISGTHGVEGFAGSAIQLAAIANKVCVPDDGDAIIFVHVLNPYGMAWLRRVNENNVDLNRNFLPDNAPYDGVSDGYKAMHSTLNPQSGPRFDFFLLRSLAKIIQHGYSTLKQAITEGQYVYPRGLFFGGKQLEEGPRTYLDWLEKSLGRVDSVCAIDVHTGLGKSGEDTLLIDAGKDDPSYQHLARIFGDRIAPWDADQSIAYQINGGHPAAVCRQLGSAEVDFITQEFGTIAGLKVLYALRQENRWHQWGNGDLKHSSKQGLLDAFRPDTDRWRASVLRRGIELLQQVQKHTFK
ncbi:MAG: DUF2817 domain-containing protein [Myxococcota bacterium]|nr:DUF2817 domain-containing protein [Myxococcota bacterium]